MTKTNMRMNSDSFKRIFTSKATLAHIVKKYTCDLSDYETDEIEDGIIIDFVKDYYNVTADGIRKKDLRAVFHVECDDEHLPERIYYSVNYIEHADENYLRRMLMHDCLDLHIIAESQHASFIGHSIFFCNVGHKTEYEHALMMSLKTNEGVSENEVKILPVDGMLYLYNGDDVEILEDILSEEKQA